MAQYQRAMHLQKAFKSQLLASQKIVKEKKLSKHLKQLQSALALCLAAFERQEETIFADVCPELEYG